MCRCKGCNPCPTALISGVVSERAIAQRAAIRPTTTGACRVAPQYTVRNHRGLGFTVHPPPLDSRYVGWSSTDRVAPLAKVNPDKLAPLAKYAHRIAPSPFVVPGTW